MMATKKSTRRGAARRAAAGPKVNPNTPVAPYDEDAPGFVPFAEREELTENPNTPVAPYDEDDPRHVPFAEREPVTENPNTPVAPETPKDPNAIPFAARDGDGEPEE